MNQAKQPIQFIDLSAQQEKIRPQVDEAVKNVLDHGQYVMGPEVFELEKQLTNFSGRKHVVSCASGTDALTMCLMAKGIGAGDAVFVPSFTFTATAEVVAALGATPVFVDVDPNTFTLSVESLKSAIQMVKTEHSQLKMQAVIPVDLFGLPADHRLINAVAQENDMWLLVDAAQSAGAIYKEAPTLSQGTMATTSFFPAKPLGGYGDGGAIFLDDDELAEKLKSIRVHGQGKNRNENVRIGLTGRLDTIQAAILLEKLKIFPNEIEHRQKAADYYSENLKNVVQVPVIPSCCKSVWAQYTIKVAGKNLELQAKLKEKGIPTAIYYSKPLHVQPAYNKFPVAPDNLKNTMELSRQALSLPMHPYLERSIQDYIIEEIKKEFH